MSKPAPTSYSDEGIEFRGDLNIQKIIYDQITLCNRVRVQDPSLFAECVEELYLLIPWQQQIEVDDEYEDYTNEVKEWRPALIDGELGSSDPDHPDLVNIPGTLRYNPKFNNGQPKQVSPIWHEESVVDPHLKLKKIMLKLQGIGYTHKQDEQQKDWGDIPDDEPVPPPTPTFDEDEVDAKG
jgi:hypothetical protein